MAGPLELWQLLGCHTGFGSESTTSSSHFYSAPCRLAELRANPTTPLSPPYIVGSFEEPRSTQRSGNCRIENVSGDPSPWSQPPLALLCIGLSSGYVFPHTVVVLPRAVLYSLTRHMLSVIAIIMIPIPYPWAVTCFQFCAFLKSPAIFDLPNWVCSALPGLPCGAHRRQGSSSLYPQLLLPVMEPGAPIHLHSTQPATVILEGVLQPSSPPTPPTRQAFLHAYHKQDTWLCTWRME